MVDEVKQAEQINRYCWREKKRAKNSRQKRRRIHKEILNIHYDKLTRQQRESARMQLFIKQDGRCAICERPEKELNRILCLDHCHKTGHIRGLLCNKCNWMLGYAEDNLLNLQAAMQYLLQRK